MYYDTNRGINTLCFNWANLIFQHIVYIGIAKNYDQKEEKTFKQSFLFNSELRELAVFSYAD